MKKGYLYTVVFTMICAPIFTAELAFTQGSLTPKINENQTLFVRKAIMYAFNMDTKGTNTEVNQNFDKFIKLDSRNGVDAFAQLNENGEEIGYAFPFQGSGLWGQIKGYIALDKDLKEVKGLTFTEQNETPGLGGRIDEMPFKEQFRGMMMPEGELKYGKVGDKEIDAITGATLTSNSVIRILNDAKTQVIEKWGGK